MQSNGEVGACTPPLPCALCWERVCDPMPTEVNGKPPTDFYRSGQGRGLSNSGFEPNEYSAGEDIVFLSAALPRFIP